MRTLTWYNSLGLQGLQDSGWSNVIDDAQEEDAKETVIVEESVFMLL